MVGRCRQWGGPGEVQAGAYEVDAESKTIHANMLRCGTGPHRCGQCSRRNEQNSDALGNCLAKPPALLGRTRWNPNPQSGRVLPLDLHRQNLAKSKDLGRGGWSSKRRKWLYGRRQICRGSACLRGNPRGEHGSPRAAVRPWLCCWRAIALFPMRLALRARLATARKHRIVPQRPQIRTNPAVKPGEKSAPLRSRHTKQGSLAPDHKKPELLRRTSSLSREDYRCRAEAGSAARECPAAPSRQLHVLPAPLPVPSPPLPTQPPTTLPQLPSPP